MQDVSIKMFYCATYLASSHALYRLRLVYMALTVQIVAVVSEKKVNSLCNGLSKYILLYICMYTVLVHACKEDPPQIELTHMVCSTKSYGLLRGTKLTS